MTSSAQRSDDTPRLCAGDRLTRDEFHRRYEAMPEVKKAELIEGVVYMPSPVSQSRHGHPHALLMGWLVLYTADTPGVEPGDNASLLLDLDNEPQPDALLRIAPRHGEQSRDLGDYIDTAPELVAEVAASSASYDLHDKLHVYRRNGVQEYIVWRTDDAAIDWFVLRGSRYERLPVDTNGVVRSEVFPGLWLATRAMVGLDAKAVRTALENGIATPEHAAFVESLQRSGG